MRIKLVGEVRRVWKILHRWLHMPNKERCLSKGNIAVEVSWNISWNTSTSRLATSGIWLEAAAATRT
jgi:hypothetical protein